MAQYSESVKNFERVRDYMREFYVYGFKSREDYTQKSARSYDDERRRLESWLGDHMSFKQTSSGKNVFISIDSRTSQHNPLYRAWKAKSFTDGDITLHFMLMDILPSEEILLSGKICSEEKDSKEKISTGINIKEIMSKVDDYLSMTGADKTFDESTIRKKLKEYIEEGLVKSHKVGKNMLYCRTADVELPNKDLLDFFSETAPCGVIGSFLLDKEEPTKNLFSFKHHYITNALDSEILCDLFEAMSEKRMVTLTAVGRKKDKIKEHHAVPLKILESVQNGRQYLMAFVPSLDRIVSYRTDYIIEVKSEDVCPDFDELREKLAGMRQHIWGVSTEGHSGERMEHVDFTVHYGDDEQFIHTRLEREKRCGTVERIDDNTSRFSADVYDCGELVPWIRTFICRIDEIHFSDKELEEQFKKDIEEMYLLYDIMS